jgi:hypothetical protein
MDRRATLRSPLWNTVSAVMVTVMAGGCVALAMVGSVPGLIRVLMVALALSLLVGAGRVLTVGVLATPDTLVVRELFRTRRVPWDAVRSVRLVSYYPQTFGAPSLSTPMPELRYVDAHGRRRTIRVAALGARRTAAAQRNVDKLRELIRTHGLSAPKAQR